MAFQDALFEQLTDPALDGRSEYTAVFDLLSTVVDETLSSGEGDDMKEIIIDTLNELAEVVGHMLLIAEGIEVSEVPGHVFMPRSDEKTLCCVCELPENAPVHA